MPPVIPVLQLKRVMWRGRTKESLGSWEAATDLTCLLLPGVSSAGSFPPDTQSLQHRRCLVTARLTNILSTSQRKQNPLSTTESQGGPRTLHQSRQQGSAKQQQCLVKPQEDSNSNSHQSKRHLPGPRDQTDTWAQLGEGTGTVKIDTLS